MKRHNSFPDAASRACTVCASIDATSSLPPASTGAVSLPPTFARQDGETLAATAAVVLP